MLSSDDRHFDEKQKKYAILNTWTGLKRSEAAWMSRWLPSLLVRVTPSARCHPRQNSDVWQARNRCS